MKRAFQQRATAARAVTGGRAAATGRRTALRTLAGAVLGLSLFAHFAQAEDRSLTLAIVNYQSLLSPQFQNLRALSPAAEPTAPSVHPDEKLVERARLLFREGASLPATPLFSGSPLQPESANLLWLTRHRVRAGTFEVIWNRVEAGYGTVFRDYSALVHAHQGTRWEEPGYGYLKVSFRF